jgi:translation initiation factor 1
MAGLFDGTPLERPVTCEVCERPLFECRCPRDADGKVLLPRQQTARIRLEKRRKGKSVTTISGLDPAASDLPAILRDLKRRCSTGGTICDGVLELQGDQQQTAADALNEMGYKVSQT